MPQSGKQHQEVAVFDTETVTLQTDPEKDRNYYLQLEF